jgi:hypothetical protein
MAKMDYEKAWKELKRHLLDERLEIVKRDGLKEPEELARFRNFGEVVGMMDYTEEEWEAAHLGEVIGDLPE